MKLTLILLAGCLLTPSGAIAEELYQKSPNTQNIPTKTNLVAAWNPVKIKTSSKQGAKEKTQIALENFKAMSELKPYFKKAKGYAVFPTVGKVQDRQDWIEAQFRRISRGSWARIIRMARKPSPQEFKQTSIICGIGLFVLGAIGFGLLVLMDNFFPWLIHDVIGIGN